MIISVYQCDPEIRLVESLQRLVDEMGLSDPDRNGKVRIDTSKLFAAGHPLYDVAAKGGSYDTALPRVGVEWQTDRTEDTLGFSTRRVRMTERLRGTIAALRDRGGTIRMGLEERRDADYEQVSAKKFDAFLSLEGYVEYCVRPVESVVVVSGWASGFASRKSAQFLYQAVEAVLPFACNEIATEYGVSVRPEGQHEVNLFNDQFAGGNAFGFEMRVIISQTRRSYRHLPNYSWPKRPDIHLSGSKTEFLPAGT